MKTYKYRIYPTKEQQQMLAHYFGNVRFVYNRALETRDNLYKNWKKPNLYMIQNMLPSLKEQYPWLKNNYAQTLQSPIRDLSQWYVRFFKKISKHPKFKRKKWEQSIHYPQKCRITEWWNIFVPKLWEIKTKLSRECLWKIKSVTITYTVTHKYFVSITTDFVPRKPIVEWSVWIDLWIKEFATLSNWEVIHFPNILSEFSRKLWKMQRKLSHKQKWGKNYEKQRLKIARLYEYISNKRTDFLEKITYKLANEYHTIIVEWMDIVELSKKTPASLSGKIYDAWWWKFRSLLDSKANNLIKIDKYYPSTKLCSYCWCEQNMALSDRTFCCRSCWKEIDRDLNAAINILTAGT